VVGIPAEVQDLHRDLAAGIVHGLCHHPVFVAASAWVVMQAPPGIGRPARWGDAAGHDQAHAAAGTLGIEGGHAREAVARLLQAHVHGAHEHPVLQGGEAQVQGASKWG
jgi:hypothetical protein